MSPLAQHLPAAHRRLRAGPRVLPRQVGLAGAWSIVALTVCVRALLLPLAIKQFRSMQALQELAPELKKIQEKYKDDKQRQQQEIMKFYQENKVNPLASCLPLVLQLPVFLALFYMLRTDLARRSAGQRAADVVCEQVSPGLGPVPLHPGPDGQGDGRGARRADRPVRQLAAAVEHADAGDGGQDAAHDLHGAAVHLRPVHHPVPGRPASSTGSRRTSGRSSQQTALRKIMGAPKPPPLNPDGTRPGPFDEILKQFRKPPAEQPSNGGKGGEGRRREARAQAPDRSGELRWRVVGQGLRLRRGGGGDGGNGGGTPREPGAKPPPPPRKRAKKRSGRRR